MTVVTILYYAMVGFISVVMLVNLVRSTKWEREILYILVLVPFLLRLFRLK
jgi:hypothetical protein